MCLVFHLEMCYLEIAADLSDLSGDVCGGPTNARVHLLLTHISMHYYQLLPFISHIGS